MIRSAATADPADREALPKLLTSCSLTLPALERQLNAGLLREWTELVQLDPLAHCFQSPGWCVPWYRSYHDEFDPFVVIVRSDDALVGIVPLAVRRGTREICFASGTMADYRDIVARADVRAQVVSELLRVYRDGGFPNPLQIGWVDPASDTPSLVAAACDAARMRFTAWQQPCYRWFPVDGENLNKKFSRVRTHLNHFKRSGEVTFDVITRADEWTTFRDEFFRQHSLRQLQADRAVSFDDPRRQRFYDRLFDSAAFQTHVTALRLDGQLLAGHLGLVWRDVLMLGAPSISIEHEQRSPALILLSWVMQNARELGLRGFDLTVGDTDFKKRLGNQCVSVTTIEVYARTRNYYARAVRNQAVALAKGAVAAVAGGDAWKRRVKPTLDRIGREVEVVRAHGIRVALRSGGARQEEPAARYPITPESLPALEAAAADVPWQLHENRIEDLLLPSGSAPSTSRAIRDCARTFSKHRASGATLYTLVAGARLAAWCIARPAHAEATVVDLHVTPDMRERGAEQALLSRVARDAFSRGAARLRITRG